MKVTYVSNKSYPVHIDKVTLYQFYYVASGVMFPSRPMNLISSEYYRQELVDELLNTVNEREAAYL